MERFEIKKLHKDDPLRVGKEGVAQQYANEHATVIMQSKIILGKPGFNIDDTKKQQSADKGKFRRNILSKVKNFPTYSEFAQANKDELSHAAVTEKGKATIVRLDEIALALRAQYVKDYRKINLEAILSLLEEAQNLILNQES